MSNYNKQTQMAFKGTPGSYRHKARFIKAKRPKDSNTKGLEYAVTVIQTLTGSTLLTMEREKDGEYYAKFSNGEFYHISKEGSYRKCTE